MENVENLAYELQASLNNKVSNSLEGVYDNLKGLVDTLSMEIESRYNVRNPRFLLILEEIQNSITGRMKDVIASKENEIISLVDMVKSMREDISAKLNEEVEEVCTRYSSVIDRTFDEEVEDAMSKLNSFLDPMREGLDDESLSIRNTAYNYLTQKVKEEFVNVSQNKDSDIKEYIEVKLEDFLDKISKLKENNEKEENEKQDKEEKSFTDSLKDEVYPPEDIKEEKVKDDEDSKEHKKLEDLFL